jgi:outer membrane protein OmpA-like peptidoglycan-associated protein
MAEKGGSFWIGAAAGLVIVAAAAPAAFYVWKADSADRAATRSELAAVKQQLAQTNQSLLDMRKTASVVGISKQLDELNWRIKSTNEALAGLQKTSAGMQRSSLETIAARLDRLDAGLKINSDAVAGLLKSVPLTNLAKQIGEVQANLAALDIALADLKRTSTAGDSARRFDALDAAVKSIGGTLGAIKTGLDGNHAALAELKTAPPAAAAPQVASTLDKIKKNGASSTAERGSMDLVVIHAESSEGNKAPANVATAMAPLGFEFKRVGASEDKTQTAAIIAKVKDVLKDRSHCAISVAGYADTLGDDGFNLGLSKQRAHHVALKLREALGNGVQIAETGWGARRLQVWTPDNTPKAENRRVDIAVHCAG